MLTRRDLLRAACAAGVGIAFPGLLHAGGYSASPDWTRSLVLIELDGGNDGLNTVIPYDDSIYHTRRSTLRVASGWIPVGTATVRTGAATTATGYALGLNPVMSWFNPAWAAGELAIVLGLGMDNPNRSHFRGIDIWNQGTSSATTASDGWMRRVLAPTTPPPDFAAHAVVLSRASSNPIGGATVRTLAMKSPAGFITDADRLKSYTMPSSTDALRHVIRTNNDIVAARELFKTKLATVPTFTATYPTGSFGDQCRYVAQMICAGLDIPVYKIRIGGFDNHSTQRAKHDDLLAQLSRGMAALRASLIQHGRWDRVLLVTYSEFGRRVEQNGSNGTDHGTAAPHLVMGHTANINGGLFGIQPGLGYLDSRWDLIATNDYRRLYATAARFLGYDASTALGATFATIGTGTGETTPLLKP